MLIAAIIVGVVSVYVTGYVWCWHSQLKHMSTPQWQVEGWQKIFRPTIRLHLMRQAFKYAKGIKQAYDPLYRQLGLEPPSSLVIADSIVNNGRYSAMQHQAFLNKANQMLQRSGNDVRSYKGYTSRAEMVEMLTKLGQLYHPHLQASFTLHPPHGESKRQPLHQQRWAAKR